MSSDSTVIRVDGLGKRYEIYERPKDRLKQMVLPRLQRLLAMKPQAYFREFWALSDVSFEVAPGEAVGILGKNGSGKSTLLQLICQTLTPTMGGMHVHGRVAALLELGAGFNPDFTGRENIFLSGLIYGLSDEELRGKYDGIVAFAEIGEYINQPVKTYSSGMYVRLAFAVAAFCDPDILVVDEALAVGDVYFQRKCFRRIDELRAAGCTLLFVTHSIDVLLQLCDRGIVLDKGRMLYDGPSKEAVSVYMQAVFGTHSIGVQGENLEPGDDQALAKSDARSFAALGEESRFHQRAGYNADETRVGNGVAQVLDFQFMEHPDGSPILHVNQPFSLMVRYRFLQNADRLIFGVHLRSREGMSVYSANTFTTEGRVYEYPAGSIAVAEFKLSNALLPGQYFLTVGVSRFDNDGEIQALDRRVDAIVLTVIGSPKHASGMTNLNLEVSLHPVSDP